jgi:hypothetical protein
MTAEAGRPHAPSAAPAAASTRLGLIYAALVAATIAPLAIWPIPPSFDLVNHWARLTLYHMAPGDPLAALYQVRLAPIPDLAIDLAGFALSPFLTPYGVIALAWVAAIALPAWGAWLIGKAIHQTPQAAVLLAPALSYNLVVTLGLLNFAIGMGLAMIAFAASLRIDRRRWLLRLVLFNVISAALFFSHVAAFLAFSLLVVANELPRSRRGWRLPRSEAARALATVGGLLAGFALLPLAPTIDARAGGPGSKLAALAAPMYDWTAAAGVLGVLALVIVVSAGILSRRVAFAPMMVRPLGLLLLVVAFAPSAHGAADFIDARLAVLLAYLVFASLSGPSDARAKAWTIALAIVAVAARIGVAAPHWAAYDGWAAELRAAIRAVPPGARVLAVAPPRGRCPALDDADFYRGLVNFVVIDRRALASTLFTGRGMQPVAAADPRLDATPWTPPHPEWLASHDWRALYDTLIALHVDCDWRPDEAGLVRVGETPQATIYRVR